MGSLPSLLLPSPCRTNNHYADEVNGPICTTRCACWFLLPAFIFSSIFSTSYTTGNRAIRWTIYNCESPILVRLTVSFFTLFPGAKREIMREWSLYHEPFNDFSRCGRSVRSFFGSSSRFLIDEEAFFHKAISPFFCPSASYLVNIGMGLVSTKTKGVGAEKRLFFF